MTNELTFTPSPFSLLQIQRLSRGGRWLDRVSSGKKVNKTTACGRLAGAVFLLEMTQIITKEGKCEIRTHLENRIARVLFALKDGQIILLHGFIKKSQKTRRKDLDLGKERMKKL
ncbi:MAG: type II toxin-antitoxin system RelE/ParE family toxin [Pelovirga sp.]